MLIGGICCAFQGVSGRAEERRQRERGDMVLLERFVYRGSAVLFHHWSILFVNRI